MDATRSAFRYGQRWSPVCPGGALNFTLDEVGDTVTVTVTATGNTISWTPNDPATWLAVDSGGDIKWMVTADADGFTGPVTFGTVPVLTPEVFPRASAQLQWPRATRSPCGASTPARTATR
ncbi:MAG: hypothetical protein IPN77_28250 [Sandaracinaceae bacterium]|nr:hypothetical protein [Sandaracinaceae bacterium]